MECADFTWTVHSTDFVPVDSEVGLIILPDAIHIMHKSVTPDAMELSVEDEDIGPESENEPEEEI